MKTVAEKDARAASKASLQRAVDKFNIKILGSRQEIVGDWSVETGDDRLMLVWSIQADDPRALSMGPDVPTGFDAEEPDAPWAKWGGNEIMEDAGMGDYNDHQSGCDQYQDGHGNNIVSQWVTWTFKP